ncbi:hypothetical protein VTK73DRAFT_1699 [Phialemonium thermophilum]|uniref:Calcium channel YVC1-like C-terminal transmembrane domain-containing protein n=1 Tax=Phialemonium thermophilum TaxID=223376 RepID=A0ABR3X7W0_9PEZI
MPLRVKSRPGSQVEAGQRTPSPFGYRSVVDYLPEIEQDDSFRDVVKKLSIYIRESITLPSTFEQLRTTSVGDCLRVLVDHLSVNCTNPAIVNALLALKWHYGTAAGDKGLNEARANSCEIVAWRFLTHLSEREAVDFCLYEIPASDSAVDSHDSRHDEENPALEEREDAAAAEAAADERTALLAQTSSNNAGSSDRRTSHRGDGSSRRSQLLQAISRLTMSIGGDDDSDDDAGGEDDPSAPFVNLNALEIAAIADAKRFLSQNVVQKIVTGIWNGDIVFWDGLSVRATKRPRFYDPRTADAFSRLRVPKYLKSYEVVFFATFLALYYAVLVGRDPGRITGLEVTLYIWFAAFLYDEVSEWIDAGSIFYAVDVWNLFDMVMILIGFLFAVLRIIGLSKNDQNMIDFAFDVLALEALFMVPRVCSILSLSPYWGTLIPCLKEMAKDFIKFMVLVVVIYLGFLTTFSLVGREAFTFRHMTMVLTKIFFGSSYVGFDIMEKIDPIFGPPLMIIFVTLSSILLMGSLTGMLSNSFSRVITHAREEYLYVYSVYVLEASTSNRLTHFYPPFNLVALVIFRPLRLFLPSDDKFRAARIFLLKATHLPIVAAIQLYELIRDRISGGPAGAKPYRDDEFSSFKGPLNGPSRHAAAAAAATGAATSDDSDLITPKRKKQKRLRPSTLRLRGVSSSYLSSVAAALSPSRQPNVQQPSGNLGDSMMTTTSASDTTRAPGRRRDADLDDVDGAASTAVEVRIADLETKIDRLTELVLNLQSLQPGPVDK